MFVNPTIRYASIGWSFRFFGSYPLSFFMPKYFDIMYEDYQVEFSILNAVIVSFLGLFANIMAGVIADKYE